MAGGTALMHAAIHGHASVVRELGEMGADMNARMKDGATAAMLAAQARVRSSRSIPLREWNGLESRVQPAGHNMHWP